MILTLAAHWNVVKSGIYFKTNGTSRIRRYNNGGMYIPPYQN